MRKGLIILSELQDRDLIWLSRAGRVRDLANGDTLIAIGVVPEELHFVTEGRLVVSAADGSALAELGIGDVVGEMSFVEARAPSARVSASGAARVLAVPRTALLDAFAQDTGFAARFYKALAVFLSDRLRVMSERGDSAELDERLLDTLHVAGDRMLRLIHLLEGTAA